MDLHQLKIFVFVYKHRSFSKASEEINLTQPTVSDHIRSLEEELKCRLFDRLGRSIIPTAEADLIYPKAVDLIERSETIKELIFQSKDRIGGEIVIGASTIPGTYLLPNFIKTFKALYPEVTFHVLIADSSGVYEKLINHDILMGMMGVVIEDEALLYEPFYDEELVLVSSPSLNYPTEIKPEAMKNIPFVLREPGSGTRKETENIFKKVRINYKDINVVSTLGSTEAVREAVKAGLGCSVLSALAVKDELRHGLVKKIAIKGVQMKRKLYIVTHRKRSVPKRYELFKGHVHRTYGAC